ncbi:hypothetical protein EC991_006569 [Linnemannia zychae]|nr:hypothetical protein EC991_006569 [Linnemannia zychae]
MMSNNTDQKDSHISIAINPSTSSAETTPTIHSTKTLKSSLHHHDNHPDIDSNTVEPTLTSLPTLPEALHLNTSHVGIISNSSGRHQHTNSSTFQEVDIATLRNDPSDPLSDPLTDPSFFNNSRRHSAGSNSSSGFVLESPTLDSTPYEFEMQRFNAYDGSSPSTVKVITTVIPKSAATPTKPTPATPAKSSFFTGWMAVPPSLAGRPKLTQEQEDYIRREYERGPVPLMWAKSDDIENQASTGDAAPIAAPTSWFGSWGFRNSNTSAAGAAAATTVAAPPRAAVAPMASDSGRRETSQAL